MKKTTIMIVDDDKTVLRLVMMLLRDLGGEYKFVLYTNPEIALSKFSKKNPELVIADVRMLKMTGIEMCRKMREMNSGIKVIIFSGDYLKTQKIIKECKENGFHDFFSKPFSRKLLVEMVKEVLGK